MLPSIIATLQGILHVWATGYRVVFYAARSATLVLAYLWVPWMVIILLVFYLVKREMPYDLIP